MSSTPENHNNSRWISKMPPWLQKLLEVGVRAENSEALNAKTRLYNKMNLFVCLTMIVIMIMDYGRGFFPGVGIGFTIFLTTAYSFWLMHKGKFFLVAWVAIIIVTLGILLLILFYGRGAGGELTFIVMGLSCIVIFDTKRSRFFLLVLIYLAYVVSEILLHFWGPIIPVVDFFSVYLVMFAVNLMIMIVMVLFFTRRGMLSEQKTDLLLSDLQSRNAELEKANYDLGQFAYAASHHFKSPLKNISSLLGLIEKKLPPEVLDSEGKYLELLLADSKHLYLLVEDILTYSTLDSSTFERRELVDWERVLQRVTGNLLEEVNEKKVRLVREDIPDIYASESHVELMLQILIRNGFHYNESPEPEIQLSGRITKDGAMHLSISDNGIGIPQEYHNQIFDMFERLHTHTEYEGSGIGLTVCKRIMQGYGGDIFIEDSQMGQGTKVTLSFPAYKPPATTLETPAP